MHIILFLLRRLALITALCANTTIWAAAPFTDNGDGTVTDSNTYLIWDKCALGLSGSTCTGSAQQKNWAEALAAVESANLNQYLGHSDWRLPNVKELESLVQIDAFNPAIDAVTFPNTQFIFWSSTSFASAAGSAWIVGFNTGLSDIVNKVSNYYSVRLVRGGQPFAAFDVLAPVVTGPIVTPAPNGTSASGSVQVDLAATGYWQVLPANATAPTAAQLQSVGTVVPNMAANTPTTLSLTGLTPGIAYKLYFVAVTGSSNASAVQSATFTTPIPVAAPGAPFNVQAAAGDGQVLLSWQAPTSGGAVDSYSVTANGTPINCTASPCTITGLTNGTAYSFVVTASNAGGSMPAAAVGATPRAKLPPPQPGTGGITPVPALDLGSLMLLSLLAAGLGLRQLQREHGSARSFVPATPGNPT